MDPARRHSLSPRDIARVLFRQWKKMAVVFGGIVVLTLLWIALCPRSYTSESKLFFSIGRESVALDPTVTTGPTNLLQKTMADEVNSALNILNSRAVLERASERVGPARILDRAEAAGAAPRDAAASDGFLRRGWEWASGGARDVLESLRLSDPVSDHDLAVRQLEKGVKVSAPKDSLVVTISYSASSPELAHDVVDAITKVFLEEHLRLNHSEGALDFFAVQTDQLHRQLLAAQTELRDRKNTFQLTSNANRQSALEKSKDALRQKLYDLELQESDLQSRYTDAYPPLKEIRRQRGEAERLLVELPAEHSAPLLALSPAPAPPPSANRPLNNLSAELQSVNDQEYQLSQLELSVQLLEGKYRMHVEKLEQARVNDALERQRISNIKVAEAATLVGRPDTPQKRLLFLLGLLLATGGAVGLAFVAECVDQTLRTTDQIEAKLGLPVLLSLPRDEHPQRPSTAMATTSAVVNGSNHQETNGSDRHQHLARYGALVRWLTANDKHSESGSPPHARTIGVVGCEPTARHSQVAADLAIQAASETGVPVLLIDAEAHPRRVTQRNENKELRDWRDVLAGATATRCVPHPAVRNLAVLSLGGPNRAAVAAGPAVAVLEQPHDVRTAYALVVVDLPTADESGKLLMPTDCLDDVVLVVEAEQTRIQTAHRTKLMLERAGVPIAGVVLVNRREHIPRWLYQRL
jgi:uncharacterized protein involved in exopolysaccharide biosynthesis/Mrp family chromosome partitioning ATPase